MQSSNFADLGLSPPTVGALRKQGITEPFAVQRLQYRGATVGDLRLQLFFSARISRWARGAAAALAPFAVCGMEI